MNDDLPPIAHFIFRVLRPEPPAPAMPFCPLHPTHQPTLVLSTRYVCLECVRSPDGRR